MKVFSVGEGGLLPLISCSLLYKVRQALGLANPKWGSVEQLFIYLLISSMKKNPKCCAFDIFFLAQKCAFQPLIQEFFN